MDLQSTYVKICKSESNRDVNKGILRVTVTQCKKPTKEKTRNSRRQRPSSVEIYRTATKFVSGRIMKHGLKASGEDVSSGTTQEDIAHRNGNKWVAILTLEKVLWFYIQQVAQLDSSFGEERRVPSIK